MTHVYNVMKITMVTLLVMFVSFATFAQTNDTSVSVQREDNDWKKEFPKPHMGLIAGVSDANHYKAGAEVGVDVGYQPYVPYGLGLEVSTVNNNEDGKSDLTRTKFLVKGTYNFGGTTPVLRDSYVGLGVGPMLESFGGDTNVAVGFMPTVGFDVPLARGQAHDYMSLGLAARYLASTNSDTNAFSVNGALKYWF